MEAYRQINIRLCVIGVICFILFIILGLGLGYRQLILSSYYLRQENSQSLRRIVQPGPRGNIYDRNKNLLVGNQARFSLILYLAELREEFRKEYFKLVQQKREEKQEVNRTQLRKQARYTVVQSYIDKVNQILGTECIIPESKIERHFQQRLLLPMVVLEDLSPQDFAKLTEQLPVYSPLQLYTDTIRYYPYGSSAAHVLGYISNSQEVSQESIPGEHLATFYYQGKIGKNGLEKSFDEHLKGISGGEVWRVDPSGFQYELVYQRPPMQGQHLICSLDIHLQAVAEKALGHMRGAVVALDIPTGQVLAMASKPDYDLNDLSTRISTSTYNSINERGAWLNRALQGIYPPGSPFKLVTSIAGFRQNTLTPEVLTHCKGYTQVGNRKFPCLKRSGHGTLDVPSSIALSCNCLFFETALSSGIEALSQEAIRLGFGQPTGIELPFESTITLVPTPEWKKKRSLGSWLGGDTANMSIGQGYLLATPLQLACFTAALAKNTTRVYPTLVYTHLNPFESDNESLGLSDSAYQSIIKGMQLAVAKGTAQKVHINGLSIAAKTGTAQVKIKNGAMDVVWCIAFAPVENPQIAIAVLVEEATEDDNFWGGTTAGPVAREVLQQYFNRFLLVPK